MEPGSRRYHHGNLREALLEGAERALAVQGIHELTLRDLCRDLGVSHASTRRHFADKRALLDALAERGFRRFAADVAAAVAGPEHPFDDRLKRLVGAQVAFAVAHPALYAWMFEAKYRAGAPAELHAANDEAFARALVVYEAGQADGALVGGDPRQLALVVFAAVQGLIALSNEGRLWGTPLDAVAVAVVERLLLGLRPR